MCYLECDTLEFNRIYHYTLNRKLLILPVTYILAIAD